MEEVCTLALEDLSWEKLGAVCLDSNADAVTPLGTATHPRGHSGHFG